jgi:S1-C subfamily serine protease
MTLTRTLLRFGFLSLSALGLLLGTGQRGFSDEDQAIQLDPVLEAAERNRIEAVQRAIPSAVSVFVPGGGGGGSGVLISPQGLALTNFHVSSPAGSYMRCGLNDGNIYDAVIVGIDPVGDLALIQLLGRDDFPVAELADSRTAQVGDWVMVIGNPFLLASNLQPTVTWGILSGVGRYQYPSGTLLEYGDCLQTDASINPGNSGGPLYDAQGRLLGIVGRASFEKRGRVNVGVGYAISINQAKNFLGSLRSGRILDHATLGATVATDPDGGVTVSNILESSDAYRRGLRYGDEILEIDGRVVRSANDVQNILATFPSGWRVKLTYRQEGETKQTLVRLMGVHLEDELLEKMAGALPPPPPRPDGPSPEKIQPGDHGPDGDQQPEGEDQPDGKDNHDEDEHGHAHSPTVDTVIPDEVSKRLIERKGYANYFFNEREQDRFIQSLRQQFPQGGEGEKLAWVIDAETDEPTPVPVQLRIASGKLSMSVGEKTIEAESKSELYDGVTARSPAGILPALDAWRRMIEEGPRKFGDSYYYGTMPLGGERPLRDAMVGIDGELEVRWLSHPESGLVEAVEVFADRDDDPAELWIVRQDGADSMPSMLDLRYGTESLLRLRIKSWQKVPATVATEGQPVPPEPSP